MAGERRIHAPLARRFSSAALGAVAALVLVTVPVWDVSVSTRLLVAGACSAALVVFVRGLTMGVRADDDRIIVSGLVSRRTHRWSEVAGFDVRGAGSESKLVMVLRDGRSVYLSGVMPSVSSRHRDRTLGEVQAELSSWMP